MKLVLVHHHLNRGGVTQIIRNDILALDAMGPGEAPEAVFLLHGPRRHAWPEELGSSLEHVSLRHGIVAELDYDNAISPPRTTARPEELARAMTARLAEFDCTAQDTILHVHNPSLGKNLSLPGALQILGNKGWHVLCHVHDFAEDGRPENWARIREGNVRPLHPAGERIHHAVLTTRDLAFLQQAGFPEGRAHLLPNPIPDEEGRGRISKAAARRKLAELVELPETATFCLCPVRGIRRKNLGEALLWSLLGEGRFHVGLTLPPLNPRERPGYEAWVDESRHLKAPVHFELGNLDDLSFREVVTASDLFLSTSIMEGFGMVFLESFLAERPLAGRDLPEITRDFLAAGLPFPGLQKQLLCPREWIDGPRLLEDVLEAYDTLRCDAGAPKTTDAQRAVLRARYGGDTVDFGMLWEEEQKQILRRLAESASDRECCRALNPILRDHFERGPETNRDWSRAKRCIKDGFGLAVSGRRLSLLYARMLRDGVNGEGTFRIQEECILEAFLAPERFIPLRVARPKARAA